ncbi:MAG: cation-transporting P-type ATPase [Candidatus Bathyarchaeota archaeon]
MYSRKFWSIPGSDVLEQTQSSEKGLSLEQVKDRLDQYGRNEISKREVRTDLSILLSQFKNPLVIILMGASLVAAFLGEITDAARAAKNQVNDNKPVRQSKKQDNKAIKGELTNTAGLGINQ